MRIQLDGESINIITSDGDSFKLPKSDFAELYSAFNIIKDLLDCEPLGSIDCSSIQAKNIYEL